MKTKKRLLALILTVMFMIGLSACQKGPSNDVSMYDLQVAMLAADDTFPDMITVNSSANNAEELFAYISDLDYSLVDSFFLGYSSSGLADEVAVIRLKDKKDTDDALKSLVKHQENRVKLYETYEPAQTTRAKSGVTFKEGNYVMLIISDNADKVKEAFDNGVF